jgi:hypothetical protein
MERIVGIVFSGFAVRAMGASVALYVGCKAYAFIMATFGAASALQAAL